MHHGNQLMVIMSFLPLDSQVSVCRSAVFTMSTVYSPCGMLSLAPIVRSLLYCRHSLYKCTALCTYDNIVHHDIIPRRQPHPYQYLV